MVGGDGEGVVGGVGGGGEEEKKRIKKERKNIAGITSAVFTFA